MSPWIAAAVAAGMAAFLLRSRRQYLALPGLESAPAPQTGADVVVVIPARNEARTIARAVRSFPGARVLVVDDASTDGTAAIAQAAGARAIAAPPLAPGSLGKPNACLAGARATQSEWILFVDADTWFEPGFLAALLEAALRSRLDMASVFLRQHLVTAPEGVLLPYAFALYFAGVTAARAHEGLANGQCLLFRRAAYERIGGHGAVIDSVIEDVALAAVARRARLRTRVLRAEDLGAVRMYDSLGAIWRGFQKNSFRFLTANPAGGLQVVAASILLTSYLPVLAGLLAGGHWTAAAGFALLPVALLRPWYGGWRAALAAPLAIYLFQAIALHAMFNALTGRHTLWKGRPV